MTVYAVFREGVYRHECAGVFSTEAIAKAMADALAEYEADDYHEYVVIPFEVGVAGVVSADGKRISEPDKVYSVRKSGETCECGHNRRRHQRDKCWTSGCACREFVPLPR